MLLWVFLFDHIMLPVLQTLHSDFLRGTGDARKDLKLLHDSHAGEKQAGPLKV